MTTNREVAPTRRRLYPLSNAMENENATSELLFFFLHAVTAVPKDNNPTAAIPINSLFFIIPYLLFLISSF